MCFPTEPVFPPDLALSIAAFVSFGADFDTGIIGDVTVLVPEPGTLGSVGKLINLAISYRCHDGTI